MRGGVGRDSASRPHEPHELRVVARPKVESRLVREGSERVPRGFREGSERVPRGLREGSPPLPAAGKCLRSVYEVSAHFSSTSRRYALRSSYESRGVGRMRGAAHGTPDARPRGEGTSGVAAHRRSSSSSRPYGSTLGSRGGGCGETRGGGWVRHAGE